MTLRKRKTRKEPPLAPPHEDVEECPTDLRGFIHLYWQDRKHIILPMKADWSRWKQWVTLAQGGLLVLGAAGTLLMAVATTQGIKLRPDIIQQQPVNAVKGPP